MAASRGYATIHGKLVVTAPNTGAAAVRLYALTTEHNTVLIDASYGDVYVLFGDATADASAVAYTIKLPAGSLGPMLGAGGNTHVSVFATSDFDITIYEAS